MFLSTEIFFFIPLQAKVVKVLVDDSQPFIAEGVDQTRGWFFTLHAIATIIFEPLV